MQNQQREHAQPGARQQPRAHRLGEGGAGYQQRRIDIGRRVLQQNLRVGQAR